MSKFNTATARPARGNGPVTTEPTPTLLTHEGAPAYQRDAKSELFMLAMANLVGEDTYYESATERDARFERLVRDNALADPAWTARLLVWLRGTGNMRSAPLVGAAEFVKARLDASATPLQAGEALGTVDQRGIDRAVVDAVLQRGDEPGEAMAYWLSRYGRPLPKPIKRGLADAARRLYREYPLLKYDTGGHAVRFADVIEMCRPAGSRTGAWQDDLFTFALDRRHGRRGDVPTPERLAMVRANAALRGLAAGDPQAMLDTERLREAGMTWEDVLSLVGSKLPKARLWSALIPVMGLMALARNLRNFDEAGVPDVAAAQVAARFMDPEQVARSRMFPYRWYAAYLEAPSLRWGHALDQALAASLAALPAFDGRTLVLVDTSASMKTSLSKRSKLAPVHNAAVFGVALAARGDADLVGFADRTFRHKIRTGASVVEEIRRFVARVGEVGHGTQISEALRATYAGHDRVFVVSDQQTMDGQVTTAVPRRVPIYGVNLGGYAPAMADWGTTNRIELGGLTDATFRLVPLVEAGRRADWAAVFGA